MTVNGPQQTEIDFYSKNIKHHFFEQKFCYDEKPIKVQHLKIYFFDTKKKKTKIDPKRHISEKKIDVFFSVKKVKYFYEKKMKRENNC